MPINIKNFLGDILFSSDCHCLEEAIVEAVKANVSLELADFSWCHLAGANLAGAQLSGANFEGANLKFINFAGANLIGACFDEADLSYANLSGADLTIAGVVGSNVSQANLSCADLTSADFDSSNLNGADLHNANLEGARMVRADLRGTNLENANLQEANFNLAELSGANFKGSLNAFAQVAFTGFGAYGGMLTAVRLAKDSLPAFYFSHSFFKTEEALRVRISTDDPRFRETSLIALDAVLTLLDAERDPKNSCSEAPGTSCKSLEGGYLNIDL